MRSSTGFTLIELMITVAIIGILAVLASASFITFQAKSKQSEAKTNLGAIGNA
ncbi:MAG TPA: prepilin-type N-terminal cleavage/methylation domain-containing protein, partial [Nitrospiria bacterium]|nr:prepilin-type N-terminal cleavage/methylation domain-containing protein [Nitrospiria bacterium]